MVGTIPPMVHGFRKRELAWIYLGSCIVGASATGTLLSLLGGMVTGWRGLTFSAVALASGGAAVLCSIRELNLFPWPLPQFCRQVPSRWRYTFPPAMSVTLYGLSLGAGLGTRIPFSTLYVPLIWAAASGRPYLGAWCLALFGLGRGLPVVWYSAIKTDTHSIIHGISILRPLVQLVNGVILAIAGSGLLSVALRWR